MSRRVVLRLTEHTSNRETIQNFLDQGKELGAGPRAKVFYRVHPDIGPVLVMELPESAAAVLERKERPVALTKNQQAVRDQRERRSAAIVAGEQVPGYEPPVVRRNRLKKRKT